MDITDFYPLVVVDDPHLVRDWYVRHLGFRVAAEADWFVFLTSPGVRKFGVCFMREGLDHQLPQFRQPMRGDALVLTFEVDDAHAALREFVATGVQPDEALRDEPWGQRHFMIRDPAGVWVDIVQVIAPDPAFVEERTRVQFAALNPGVG